MIVGHGGLIRTLAYAAACVVAGCSSAGQTQKPDGAASGGSTSGPSDGSGGSATGGRAPEGSGGGLAATGGNGRTSSAGRGGASAGVGGGVAGTPASTGGASAGGMAGQGSASGGAAGGTPEAMVVQQTLASLPAPRQEHGVVGLLGQVYVLGGYTPNVTASVMAYDPAKDAWRDVADFPSPFNHPAAGVIKDKIYVGGFYAGTSLTGPATGRTFVYDPAGDSWTERAALPSGTERAGGCVAVVDQDMYVFGGGNSGEATNFASVYHSASDTWETLPNLPETREHCGAFLSGGKLYIASGRTHDIPEFRRSTLEFDPVAKTYTTKTPIPTPRGGAAAAVLGGRLFLFGGEGANNTLGVFDQIQAYDAVSDSWETFPPMLIARHGFGAATIGDRIYLPGGATRMGGSATASTTVFYLQ